MRMKLAFWEKGGKSTGKKTSEIMGEDVIAEPIHP